MKTHSRKDIDNTIGLLPVTRYITGTTALVYAGIIDGNVLGAATVDVIGCDDMYNKICANMAYKQRGVGMIMHDDHTTSIILHDVNELQDKYHYFDRLALPKEANNFIRGCAPSIDNGVISTLRDISFEFRPPYNRSDVKKFALMVSKLLPANSYAICGTSADVLNGTEEGCDEIHLAIASEWVGITTPAPIETSVEINGYITELLSDSIFVMRVDTNVIPIDSKHHSLLTGEENHVARTVADSFPKNLRRLWRTYLLRGVDTELAKMHEKSPLDVISAVDIDVSLKSKDDGAKIPVTVKSIDAEHDKDTNDIVVTLRVQAV